jgi:hypothetical protein
VHVLFLRLNLLSQSCPKFFLHDKENGILYPTKWHAFGTSWDVVIHCIENNNLHFLFYLPEETSDLNPQIIKLSEFIIRLSAMGCTYDYDVTGCNENVTLYYRIKAWWCNDGTFLHQDGGSMTLRNGGNLPHEYTMS